MGLEVRHESHGAIQPLSSLNVWDSMPFLGKASPRVWLRGVVARECPSLQTLVLSMAPWTTPTQQPGSSLQRQPWLVSLQRMLSFRQTGLLFQASGPGPVLSFMSTVCCMSLKPIRLALRPWTSMRRLSPCVWALMPSWFSKIHTLIPASESSPTPSLNHTLSRGPTVNLIQSASQSGLISPPSVKLPVSTFSGFHLILAFLATHWQIWKPSGAPPFLIHQFLSIWQRQRS